MPDAQTDEYIMSATTTTTETFKLTEAQNMQCAEHWSIYVFLIKGV